MHEDTIPWESHTQRRSVIRTKGAACINRNAPVPIIKKNYNHFRYNELPREVFTFHCRTMGNNVEADIIKIWMNMDQHIPKYIQHSQKHHKEESNNGVLQ